VAGMLQMQLPERWRLLAAAAIASSSLHAASAASSEPHSPSSSQPPPELLPWLLSAGRTRCRLERRPLQLRTGEARERQISLAVAASLERGDVLDQTAGEAAVGAAEDEAQVEAGAAVVERLPDDVDGGEEEEDMLQLLLLLVIQWSSPVGRVRVAGRQLQQRV
jgi:hypothetical protein